MFISPPESKIRQLTVKQIRQFLNGLPDDALITAVFYEKIKEVDLKISFEENGHHFETLLNIP